MNVKKENCLSAFFAILISYEFSCNRILEFSNS